MIEETTEAQRQRARVGVACSPQGRLAILLKVNKAARDVGVVVLAPAQVPKEAGKASLSWRVGLS